MPTREAFHAQLAELERDIVALGVRVKGAISAAVAALAARDGDAGREVVAGDRAIDDTEMHLERECLLLIALQQPVAGDLRAIGAGLRILVDLERIADHAASIARIAVRLEGEPAPPAGAEPWESWRTDVPRMAELAQEMVARALDAYVRRDHLAARALVALDDDVDHLFSGVFGEMVAWMGRQPEAAGQAAHMLFAASHLERVGDHATNIAESVIYAATGERPELND